MAEVTENQLMNASTFNKGVEAWTKKIRGLSVNILSRTKASGKLSRELQARLLVSIHAPTKGATYAESVFNFSRCVSIHAPTKGATV